MNGLQDLLERLDLMDKHMNDIDSALGEHWVRIVALEGKKAPQVETVDLRKALMGEMSEVACGAESGRGKSCDLGLPSPEETSLKRQIEELVIQRSEYAEQQRIDREVIRGHQGRIVQLLKDVKRLFVENNELKLKAQKKKFTINVVRGHKCCSGHQWVAAVSFDTATSPETDAVCPECGQYDCFSTPIMLRYPAGGLAEIKGVGDLHKLEHFLL